MDFCAEPYAAFDLRMAIDTLDHFISDERVLYVMEKIAPAVMNGGFSSLLALSLLVSSQSHIFVSFFKIFFMICVFGLFHGLVTLPVVLTIIGPIQEGGAAEEKGEKPIFRQNGSVHHRQDHRHDHHDDELDEVTRALQQNRDNQEKEAGEGERLAIPANFNSLQETVI